MTTPRFTYRDKLTEVQAEIARREKKYKHLVYQGILKPEKADRQLKIFYAIKEDYAALDEYEKTHVES